MKVLKTITTHVVFCVFVLSLLLNYFLFKVCEGMRAELEIRQAIEQIEHFGLPQGLQKMPLPHGRDA